MTTTTFPTSPTVPRRSLRTTGKTNEVRDDSEEDWQEKRQPSLSTMSVRLDLGVSRRSHGSVTATRNKGSGKGPRIGAVGDLKAHENVSSTSTDDGNDGRRETLASDSQKIETSKNRNPGKVKVDPAFMVLIPTAQEFLQAQGITSALNFMATNANELAPAWVEWNEGAFKTNKATSDVRYWKRTARHQWSINSTKEGATPPLSNHVVEAALSQWPVVQAVVPTVEGIPFLQEGAIEFLLAQGITTAEAFLSTEEATVADALMHWRNRRDSKECSINTARFCIYEWKRSLREGQSSMPGQLLVELDAELKTLSSMARGFLSSQGIATAKAFLSTNSTTTANALMDWRNQWNSSECSISTARFCIYRWKTRLRQLQPSR